MPIYGIKHLFTVCIPILIARVTKYKIQQIAYFVCIAEKVWQKNQSIAKRRLEYFSRRLFIYIKLKGLEINVYLGFRLSINDIT